MSFTTEIKKEIIRRMTEGADVGAKKAALAAFLRTSGSVGFQDGVPSFFLVSETEYVTEFFINAFSEAFQTELSVTNATWDRMSSRDKLLLQCTPSRSATILRELGFLSEEGALTTVLPSWIADGEKERIAYVCGAFLGGGSCTLPKAEAKTGYHLEIVFLDREAASEFGRLAETLELIPRILSRKDTYVAYLKSKEAISDFLAAVGAETCLQRLSALVEERDKANRDNRAQNCIAGNADKSAIAAVRQVVAIKTLQERGILQKLGEELQTLARARLENPAMSLQELAAYCRVGKSCVSHRMRRLTELAEAAEVSKENEERKKL